VRGIRHTIKLALNGKSLLLHGDNGTGKSSVEWALRWALTGEGEPTNDAVFSNEQSFRRNIGVSPEDPEVLVSFTDGNTVKVNPGRVEATAEADAIRQACRASKPMLRRSELLNVLSSRPGDRFSYFESFLGLEETDSVIRDLAAYRTAVENRRSVLSATVDAALEPFRALLPGQHRSISTHAELLVAASKWAVELGVLEASSIADVYSELKNRMALATSDEGDRRRAVLSTLRDRAREAKRKIDEIRADLPELIIAREGLKESLLDALDAGLLRHAIVHFERAANTRCPVCGQDVDGGTLLEALKLRMVFLGRFNGLSDEVQGAIRELHLTSKGLVEMVQVTRSAISDQARRDDYVLSANDGLTIFAALPLDDHERQLAMVIGVGAASLRVSMARLCDDIIGLIDIEIERIPRAMEVPELQTALVFFQKLARAHAKLSLAEIEAASLATEHQLTQTVLESLRRARQDIARDTLGAIHDLVSEYYFSIHPRKEDDVTGAPTIDVQRHGKGTAFVRGAFDGRGVKDPTWVYSDGHLDTVGICIFLALRRFRAEEDGDPKIMILDDVIISIDLGHARRLLELLKSGFSDHQIIILTHNGLFAHWCKSILPNLERIQIKTWSLESGPQIGDFVSARERLTESLATGTPKQIALTMMEFLDEWAAEARYEYAVAVPARPGEQYTLTDIWNPLMKVLRGISKQLTPSCDHVVQLIDDVKTVPDIRNSLAAHENAFAKEYPRSTLLEVANGVNKLVDACYCSTCAAFATPTPNRFNPVMMHCPGHHIQYVHAAETSTNA
jgi:recombinational DNA repair ATPase RecF